jgi:hypothetical protein
MKTTLERAWEYHKAADELLHSRSEALMIAQAFLIVGYFQVLTSEAFSRRTDMSFVIVLVAVAVLAVIVTLILMRVNGDLSRGIRLLKEKYLDQDDVYSDYLAAVRGQNGDPGKGPSIRLPWQTYRRLWSFWLPLVFLVFWVLAGVHALLLLTKVVPR